MNLTDANYSKYSLVREMMDTVDVVKNFDPNQTKDVAEKIAAAGKLMLTGEGSSRILPAKNIIRKALTWGLDINIFTESALQVIRRHEGHGFTLIYNKICFFLP